MRRAVEQFGRLGASDGGAAMLSRVGVMIALVFGSMAFWTSSYAQSGTVSPIHEQTPLTTAR
jgi:hypothetical protein